MLRESRYMLVVTVSPEGFQVAPDTLGFGRRWLSQKIALNAMPS